MGNVPTPMAAMATGPQPGFAPGPGQQRPPGNDAERSPLLNGPWDLTVDDRGSTAAVFVSNVLSGTVTRLT